MDVSYTGRVRCIAATLTGISLKAKIYAAARLMTSVVLLVTGCSDAVPHSALMDVSYIVRVQCIAATLAGISLKARKFTLWRAQ